MQEPLRFPLSSEQCELLVAFEAAASVAELAKSMRRDASVVSRALQVLGETGVVEKRGSRWALTPLGRQVSSWTRSVAASQRRLLEQPGKSRYLSSSLPSLASDTALVLVNVQVGFADPAWGGRNHPGAEGHIGDLLAAWRQSGRPVYHVRHLSTEPSSPLRPGTVGAAFQLVAQPLAGEIVIEKSRASAFAGTALRTTLRDAGHRSLVLAGFTTNHCIDATAKAAADEGFSVFVVEDACVAFDRVAVDGTMVRAQETQRVVMANLSQEFASVIDTTCVLAGLREPEGDLA